MSFLFKELDYRETPIGSLSLRRRRILSLDQDVYEILLGEEHLMSSLFTASEIALADLGLAAVGADKADKSSLDVVVGGLGLGYTAEAALKQDAVGRLTVVELLDPVVDWHLEGLLPMGTALSDDRRCHFLRADFFARAALEEGFDDEDPGKRHDAILIDIDHTPDWRLNEGSSDFYTEAGLTALSGKLKPGGVMGLWSDALEDEGFTALLGSVFSEAWAEPVTFHNPLQDKPFTQTVYLARR
ncbi:spermidine synthase [Hwanghaeella sp.]|uniref:spermidine synthase n=1 Tax=Hwanghaeella sp. TaxID=2605943 RepID=UPI003CCBCCB5